jgi:hypothetical protein
LKKSADEIRKLNDALILAKKQRDGSEANIYEMLKDLISRIKTEIDEERS